MATTKRDPDPDDLYRAEHGCGNCEACLLGRMWNMLGRARAAILARDTKSADGFLCEAMDTATDLAELLYDDDDDTDEDGLDEVVDDEDGLAAMPVAGRA